MDLDHEVPLLFQEVAPGAGSERHVLARCHDRRSGGVLQIQPERTRQAQATEGRGDRGTVCTARNSVADRFFHESHAATLRRETHTCHFQGPSKRICRGPPSGRRVPGQLRLHVVPQKGVALPESCLQKAAHGAAGHRRHRFRFYGAARTQMQPQQRIPHSPGTTANVVRLLSIFQHNSALETFWYVAVQILTDLLQFDYVKRFDIGIGRTDETTALRNLLSIHKRHPFSGLDHDVEAPDNRRKQYLFLQWTARPSSSALPSSQEGFQKREQLPGERSRRWRDCEGLWTPLRSSLALSSSVMTSACSTLRSLVTSGASFLVDYINVRAQVQAPVAVLFHQTSPGTSRRCWS
ncbi:hypothetical protein MRX96_041063 [Rhipicephalus microplus]